MFSSSQLCGALLIVDRVAVGLAYTTHINRLGWMRRSVSTADELLSPQWAADWAFVSPLLVCQP